MIKSNRIKNIGLIIITCVITSVFSECKKYPDGHEFSFRSRASRITATWYIDSYYLNGSDQTSTYLSFVGNAYALSISKDGSYLEYGNFPDEGSIQFGDKHENLYRQSLGIGGTVQKYSILRLEFKQMWLKHTLANGNVEEIHYMAYR